MMKADNLRRSKGVVALALLTATTASVLLGASASSQAIAGPKTSTVVTLYSMSDDRSPSWKLVKLIEYGVDADSVGLAAGGDAGAPGTLYGPEGAAPIDAESWWVLDTANHRAALFTPSGVTSVPVDAPLQFPLVDRSGLLYATTGTKILKIDQASKTATEVSSDLKLAIPNEYTTFVRPVMYSGNVAAERLYLGPDASPLAVEPLQLDGARLTASGSAETGPEGVLLTDAGALTLQSGLRLEATRPPDAKVLSSLVEIAVDAFGVTHILWYGYWDLNDGTPSENVGSYIQVRDGQVVVVEPIGDIRSRYDPGTPSRLHILPNTSTPAVVIIGEKGVEGWVRE